MQGQIKLAAGHTQTLQSASQCHQSSMKRGIRTKLCNNCLIRRRVIKRDYIKLRNELWKRKTRLDSYQCNWILTWSKMKAILWWWKLDCYIDPEKFLMARCICYYHRMCITFNLKILCRAPRIDTTPLIKVNFFIWINFKKCHFPQCVCSNFIIFIYN